MLKAIFVLSIVTLLTSTEYLDRSYPQRSKVKISQYLFDREIVVLNVVDSYLIIVDGRPDSSPRISPIRDIEHIDFINKL